jgi:fructosamine-3-kinase
MEFIKSSDRKKDFWMAFGQRLAGLHRHTNEKFGLDHDNFIGSLPQKNNFHDEWPSFFIEERLEVQIRLAKDHSLLSKTDIQNFEYLFNQLNQIFPDEPPALIHGDLWSGNFMVDEKGEPCIIDPAVYYGHREMDIAMSRLFGGFDRLFYESYNREFPMEPGWEERMDICNLYPLMVHVNLFGEGYLGSVRRIIGRF